MQKRLYVFQNEKNAMNVFVYRCMNKVDKLEYRNRHNYVQPKRILVPIQCMCMCMFINIMYRVEYHDYDE